MPTKSVSGGWIVDQVSTADLIAELNRRAQSGGL